MPEEFDPAWEYYSPDPEIVEILPSPPKLQILTVFDLVEARWSSTASLRKHPLPKRGPRSEGQRPLATCLCCRKPFRPVNGRAKFCDRTCYTASLVCNPRRCLRCGKAYNPRSAQSKYCSNRCREASVQTALRSKLKPVVCAFPFCPRNGRPFHPTYKGVRYCGHRCAAHDQHLSKRSSTGRSPESR